MIFKRSLTLAVFMLASNLVMAENFLPWGTVWKVLLGISAVLGFVLLNIFVPRPEPPAKRLRLLAGGIELIGYFMATVLLNVAGLLWLWLGFPKSGLPSFSPPLFIFHLAVIVLAEAVIFWNGIVKLYISSVQLGIRNRVLGVILGWVPVANIVMLVIIFHICREELKFESARIEKDRDRVSNRICATKYPLLLVHGVFFRDIDLDILNYWGRIPEELERNGARIFYGNQQSASSVEDSAGELAAEIVRICAETGCEKVNIIAHSKGGLDSRYAISRLGMAEKVASLTTVNTPHRGCLFAEYLLDKTSDDFEQAIARKYNGAMSMIGDHSPDFLAAVYDLTASSCEKLNEECPDADGVLYQSVGSRMKHSCGGRFPLNLSYRFVKYFDGDNDGLVAVDSMVWGEDFTFVKVEGKRGVSHGDMIDLNRENIPGFDVREFYVELVSKLKQRGL